MQETEFFQLSATTAILLLAGFYGATFLMSLLIGEKNENVDGYMVSNNAVGFGLLFLVLLLRPKGLFGTLQERKV